MIISLDNLPLVIAVPSLGLIGAWTLIKAAVKYHVNQIDHARVQSKDVIDEFRALFESAKIELNDLRTQVDILKHEVTALRGIVKTTKKNLETLSSRQQVTKADLQNLIYLMENEQGDGALIK